MIQSRKHKPLSIDERKIIEKYKTTNLSCLEISKIIKRGKNSVVMEYRRNGGREDYTAKKAHENAAIRQKQKNENLSKVNKANSTMSFGKMKERIENLEMQVEILHNTIKRLIND